MTIACLLTRVMLDFYKLAIAEKLTRECYEAVRSSPNERAFWRCKIDAAEHTPPARIKSRVRAMRCNYS